ncbi:MAG: GIY-YIG nuclease family protein [Chloroflexi bacterium]|nr:GIY-YIG nuclease family protein [Chloroflexota bacterium]
MQGVYRIRNKVNDKRYIGSTNDFEKGWKERLRTLRKRKYHNPHLQRAWNKYGEENFVFEIEEEVEGDNKALLACEQVYLDEGFALGILYNIARIAGGGAILGEGKSGMSGKHHSEETKNKMSKAKMGEKNNNYGKPMSEEQKDKIGQANSNPSEEIRAKIRKAKLGHKMPKENRAKLDEVIAGNEYSAKPYPAFYNEKTGEYIPSGFNLSRMCRERGLAYDSIYDLKRGYKVCSPEGWRLG